MIGVQASGIRAKKEEIVTALTNVSEPTRQRILQVCVRLFLEKGYKKTTMSEILRESSASNSSFQNIFHTKDGVLFELIGEHELHQFKKNTVLGMKYVLKAAV